MTVLRLHVCYPAQLRDIAIGRVSRLPRNAIEKEVAEIPAHHFIFKDEQLLQVGTGTDMGSD